MIRALTIIAAVAALAVSAAPVASARTNAPFTVDMVKKPPSQPDLMLKAKPKAPAQRGWVDLATPDLLIVSAGGGAGSVAKARQPQRR